MRHLQLSRWAAVLMLALALAPPAASAQEDDTVTISGTFSMDYAYGENDLYYVAPELLAVYANGYEHTWTLTLQGTTQSHYSNEIDYGEVDQDTEIHATSFDLEFFGPDAATLNSIVSEHLAGGDIWIFLRNHYMYYSDDHYAAMEVRVYGPEWYFRTTRGYSSTLFPTDADGHPVIGPEPFSIEPDYTELGYFDLFSGTGGAIGSLASPVTFEGNVGSGDPPLNIGDASVVEGDRGSTSLRFTVSRASGEGWVTVSYRTVDGTARAKSDYSAASGTLSFEPGVRGRTITIWVKGDRKREPDETLTVELFDVLGGTIGDAVATGTILNDD